MSVLFAVIRHGPTAWNAAGRIQGRSDVPLSPEGRAVVSARRLPDCLRSATWRASPLLRTRETAALLGVEAPRLDDRLIEMDWGDWEGETLEDLRRRLGEAMRENEDRGLDFTPPNGESPRRVQERLRPLLSDLALGTSLSGAITHKGVIRALLALATGWDMLGKPQVRLDWAAAHVFCVGPGGTLEPHRLNLPLTDSGPR